MKSKQPARGKNPRDDLEVFEALPAKDKELARLKDQAEKSSGSENVALNAQIRRKSKTEKPRAR